MGMKRLKVFYAENRLESKFDGRDNYFYEFRELIDLPVRTLDSVEVVKGKLCARLGELDLIHLKAE